MIIINFRLIFPALTILALAGPPWPQWWPCAHPTQKTRGQQEQHGSCQRHGWWSSLVEVEPRFVSWHRSGVKKNVTWTFVDRHSKTYRILGMAYHPKICYISEKNQLVVCFQTRGEAYHRLIAIGRDYHLVSSKSLLTIRVKPFAT